MKWNLIRILFSQVKHMPVIWASYLTEFDINLEHSVHTAK